jgi:hypothetical protein
MKSTETSKKNVGVPAEIRTLDRRMAILPEGFRLFPHSLLANSGMVCFFFVFFCPVVYIFRSRKPKINGRRDQLL